MFHIIEYINDFEIKPRVYVSDSFDDCINKFVSDSGIHVDESILKKFGFYAEHDGNFEVTYSKHEENRNDF